MKKWQENNVSELGKRLEMILDRKGIKDIKNFEQSVGLPKDYIRYLIRGYKSGIDFDAGCKIATALGIAPEELSSGKGVPLLQIAQNASSPRWYKMPGHFMEPNIPSGAYLLIDYGDTSIKNPGIFLLELAGEPAIRTCALKGDKFMTSVDNKDFPLTQEHDLNDLPTVLGRVIGIYKPL
jgi:hypothetical protein